MRFLTRCSTVVQSHPAQFPMAEGEGEEEWLEEEGEEEEVVEVVEDDDDDAPPPPPEEEENQEANRLCALVSDALFNGFDDHIESLVQARKRRQEALAFRSAVEDSGAAVDDDAGGAGTKTQDELDGMGVKLPTDKWRGDTNMRTLDKLLSRVDARGFERSAQQLEFHQAFMKAASRVIYRVRPVYSNCKTWNTQRRVCPVLLPPFLVGRLGDRPADDHGKVRVGALQLRGFNFDPASLRQDVFVRRAP